MAIPPGTIQVKSSYYPEIQTVVKPSMVTHPGTIQVTSRYYPEIQTLVEPSMVTHPIQIPTIQVLSTLDTKLTLVFGRELVHSKAILSENRSVTCLSAPPGIYYIVV